MKESDFDLWRIEVMGTASGQLTNMQRRNVINLTMLDDRIRRGENA